VTLTVTHVVVSIVHSWYLGGNIPSTVSVIEIGVESISGGSLAFFSGEELVTGSEGIISLVSSEGINIPGIVSPGLGGGSLLSSVVVSGSSTGSGSFSMSSSIGSDVIKVESFLSGSISLSTLGSSSVFSLPGISSGGSSGITGSSESVGIPGGGLSGFSVSNTSGGGLLGPGTSSLSGLSTSTPSFISPESIVEIVVHDVSGLIMEHGVLVSEVVGIVMSIKAVLSVSEITTPVSISMAETVVETVVERSSEVSVEVTVESIIESVVTETMSQTVTVEAMSEMSVMIMEERHIKVLTGLNGALLASLLLVESSLVLLWTSLLS
jgi:hypothetical protein